MHKGRKHKQQGGYLDGPLHEDGGIPAIISGGEQVELEGGEYIINAQTVDALGTQFLDKLNSTQTSYHTGGFGPNELPGPSQYANGGKIRRNNMRRRKFATGGRPHINCPPPSYWSPAQGECVRPVPPPDNGVQGHVSVRPGIPIGVGPATADNYLPNQGNRSDWRAMAGRSRYRAPMRRGGRTRRFAGGGRTPYDVGPRNPQFTIGRNPYRRGGGIRRFGAGAYLGSPNSCTDGYGNNVPC